MVRQTGTLKTRKSTLGASKSDHIISRSQRSVCSSVGSVYGESSVVTSKSKQIGKLRTRKSTIGASKNERLSSRSTVGSSSRSVNESIASSTRKMYPSSSRSHYNNNNNNNNNNNHKMVRNNSMVRRLFSTNNAIDTRQDSPIIPKSITTRKTITVDTTSTAGVAVDRDAPPPSSASSSPQSLHNNNSMRSMRSLGSKQKGKKANAATSPNSNSNSNSMRSMRSIGSQLVKNTKKKYNKKGLSFEEEKEKNTVKTNRPYRVGMIHSSPHYAQHHHNKAKSSPTIDNPKPKDKECEERIELVAMKNEKDVPFIRILISKSTYKPRAVVAPASSKNNNKNNDKQQPKPAVHKKKKSSASSENNKKKSSKSKRTSPPILKTMDTTALCGTMANVTFDNLTYNPCTAAGAATGETPPSAAAVAAADASPRETARLQNLATIPEIGRILAQSQQQQQQQQPLLLEGKGVARAVAPAEATRSVATENKQDVEISSTNLVSKSSGLLGKKEEGKGRITKAKKLQDKLSRREARKKKKKEKKKKKKSRQKDDNNNNKKLQQQPDNTAATTITTCIMREKPDANSRSLEDAATAGALAAAGAPVSTIVKYKDHDHDIFNSPRRCVVRSFDSVNSEDSDIDSDSDSDSDSDDDSDDSESEESEEESCITDNDDENKGFFQKFWPSDVSSRQIPRSVSFVTDDDSQETPKEEELLNENFEDLYYTTEDEDDDQTTSQHTHNNKHVGGKVMGAMTDIGGVFFRKKEKPKDARDLRMLDSDISNSSDEDDEDDDDEDDEDSSCDSFSHQENAEHSHSGHGSANSYRSSSKSLCLSCSFPSVEGGRPDNAVEMFRSTYDDSRTIQKIQSTTSNEDLAKSLSMIKKHAEQLGVDPTELFRIV